MEAGITVFVHVSGFYSIE